MRHRQTQAIELIAEDDAAFAQPSSIASLHENFSAHNCSSASRLNNISREQHMRNRLTQAIPLITSIFVAIIVAVIQYGCLDLDAFGVASQLSQSLLNLRQPPLRSDLPWRDKLKWVGLSTFERITPFLGLGGFEYPSSMYLRQLRQRYETQRAASNANAA